MVGVRGCAHRFCPALNTSSAVSHDGCGDLIRMTLPGDNGFSVMG